MADPMTDEKMIELAERLTDAQRRALLDAEQQWPNGDWIVKSESDITTLYGEDPALISWFGRLYQTGVALRDHLRALFQKDSHNE